MASTWSSLLCSPSRDSLWGRHHIVRNSTHRERPRVCAVACPSAIPAQAPELCAEANLEAPDVMKKSRATPTVPEFLTPRIGEQKKMVVGLCRQGLGVHYKTKRTGTGRDSSYQVQPRAPELSSAPGWQRVSSCVMFWAEQSSLPKLGSLAVWHYFISLLVGTKRMPSCPGVFSQLGLCFGSHDIWVLCLTLSALMENSSGPFPPTVIFSF